MSDVTLLTGAEEDDRLQAAVLGRVDVQRFQLLHLLLEDADVVHEGDHAVGGHRTGVDAGGGQQRRQLQRHGALRRVQHEQLAPAEPQQRHLVGHLQVGEEGDAARPLDGREEQARCQLADVLDAHDVRRLHAALVARHRHARLAALAAVAGDRVRLGAQQHRDEARQVRVAGERVSVGDQLAGERRLAGRDAAALHRCEGQTEGDTVSDVTAQDGQGSARQ